MAYQRKTNDIWREITTNIDKLFAARKQHADDWYRHGLDKVQFDQICYDAAVPANERAALKLLGDKYFNNMTELQVRIKYLKPDNSADFVHYTATLPEPCPLPGNWQDPWNRRAPMIEDPRLMEVASKRFAAQRAIAAEHNEFLDKVKKLYEAASSVNDFVKTWPAGLDLLPHYAIEQVNKKVERTKGASATKDINVNELSAHMLKARVAA